LHFSPIVLRRGWRRPSYRDVLLGVRKKLGVQCSSKLSTADLEAEIFLYLVDEYSRYLHICQIKKITHKRIYKTKCPWDIWKSIKFGCA